MADARLPLYAPRGPSLARATALSGAATVNLLVLGALLLPATLAPTLEGPRLSAVEPALLATVVEVAAAILPPSPAPAPAAQPTAPRPAPPRVSTAAMAPAPPAVDPPAETNAAPPDDPPSTSVPAIAVAGTPAGPLEGALAYVEAPQPGYPQRALRQRAEGVVLLRVRVGVDGLPLEVAVARSSGHAALDDAARRKVLRDWRFRPALRNGRAIEAVGLVPVAFRLDGG
jgi:protein TonB